eukprot:918161-Amorphochlora_amoeboformis.AAC.2
MEFARRDSWRYYFQTKLLRVSFPPRACASHKPALGLRPPSPALVDPCHKVSSLSYTGWTPWHLEPAEN